MKQRVTRQQRKQLKYGWVFNGISNANNPCLIPETIGELMEWLQNELVYLWQYSYFSELFEKYGLNIDDYDECIDGLVYLCCEVARKNNCKRTIDSARADAKKEKFNKELDL